MNNTRPTTYTPLESLFLFQLLSKHGFINGSFDRIARELQSIPLISEQREYDASRLTPAALQQLALQLLAEEQRREAETTADKGANGLSPTSKKRKLQSPPLPALKEAHEHPEKLPVLVDRLYAQFRDELIRQIREDELLYRQRTREIGEIERGEWDERIAREKQVNNVVPNGFSVEKDGRPVMPKGHSTFSATPATATPSVIQTAVSTPAPAPAQTQIAAQATASAQSGIQEPTKRVEAPHASPLPKPSGPPAPQPLHDNRPLQPNPSPLAPAATTTTTPIRSTHEQRHLTPDARPPEPPRNPTGTAPVLQHPQMTPNYIPRPAPPLHIPDGAQRPENFPNAKSPVLSQPGQAQTPSLKWEPLYQPPHHPPQQTPVPSPRPPYTTGPSRPPNYVHPSSVTPQPLQHTPQHAPQHNPQHNPQHMPQHTSQHAHNHSGARQPGPATPQPRFSTSSTAASSGPVLLPPQNAGPIPPSLQSLPLNATPDGTGQHGSHQRLPSTSVIATPTANISRPTYGQHPTTVLPTSTPVRPPPGPPATHPTVGAAKPATPVIQPPQLPTSVRHPQPQSHARPQPTHQPSAPTTPSYTQQSKGIPRSYGNQYYPPPKLAVGPDVVQRIQPPVHTPVSTPQLQRQPSFTQVHTPSRASDAFVIRGHGTKWTSTPTPSTPRIRDVDSYFETESPAFEPISPPMQAAQLPPIYSTAEKGDAGMSAVKSDPAKLRGRPPRVTQKMETAESGNAPAEPVEPVPSIPTIKSEEATPQTLQEVADTTTNEASQVRTPVPLGTSPNKRKRQDSPVHRGPPTPATHVLWTRAFHKISMTALDQIIGHRYANMFANPIKPRLAPGYYDIIHRPQDLKGIQKAITAGSKAAAATVASMSDIDPNSPAVWLPISIDLVPPRGIINIAQLERELIHMFANAIMYNPDPQRGLGPSFLKTYQTNSEEGEDLRGYEFDENGVVKETRNMFAEVEKLLGDLRNEVVPRAHAIGTGSRSVSAAVGESSTAEDDGGDEQAYDAKRRRIRG